MKSIFLTITFVFGALALSAQADNLVKVLMLKAQYEYLTSNITELQSSVETVQQAYKKADNNTIGRTKGDIIKIVHQSPSILGNVCATALATIDNPNVAGERHQLEYSEYVKHVNVNGDYLELELLPSEIQTLDNLVKSIRDKRYKLKGTGYAIHESQKAKDSNQNVVMLADLTSEMTEAIEIIKIGKHR